MEPKAPPKDAEKRQAMKAQVMERMRASVGEQGAFGVMQTHLWIRAYEQAAKMTAREFPTVKTLKKCLKAINDACEWRPPSDIRQP